MSYYNRYKTIEVELPSVRADYEGWFTFETFQAVEFPKGSGIAFEIAGTRRVRAHFKNIITNQGFNYVSTNGGFIGEVAVGTGNTPETVNDTQLQNFVAGTDNLTSGTSTAQGSAPFFGSQTNVWRFSEGQAEGILAEAGIGQDNTSLNGSDLWSRALIKDGAGDPTTVEVAANEWLDVTYQLRLYPGQLSDDTGSILISGNSHDYVIRNSLVTNGTLWGGNLSSAFPISTGLAGDGNVYETGSVLGSVESVPSGNAAGWSGVQQLGSYSADTFNQDVTFNLGLGNGNLIGGFDSFVMAVNVGVIQMSLDPFVDKDEFKIFDFTVNWAWGNRVVIP
jgi:hypothetical protein